MTNFKLYFALRECNLNEGENILELSLRVRQEISFPNQKNIWTGFELLELSATLQNKELFLAEKSIEKEFVISDINEKVLQTSTMPHQYSGFQNENDKPKFEAKIKLDENDYGQIREFFPSEREPISWDDFGKPLETNEKRKEVSWRILWNPYDGKLWNPPLENWEKAKFFENNRNHDHSIARGIYAERLNKAKKTFDLYFTINSFKSGDIIFGTKGNSFYENNKKIGIFCWPLLTPPEIIKEFIFYQDQRVDFDNSLVGELEIVFDNEDRENMAFFQKVNNLLESSKKADKFVIRNVPLVMDWEYRLPIRTVKLPFEEINLYSIDDKQIREQFSSRERLYCNNQHVKRETVFAEKVIKSMEISTKGFEKQLKLEKVSNEEYNLNVQDSHNFNYKNTEKIIREPNRENLLYVFFVMLILLLAVFFILIQIIKKQKKVK